MPVSLSIGSYTCSGKVFTPVLSFKPTVYLRIGSIKDDRAGKKIKKAIHKAIWTGFETAIENTIALGEEIVPESKYGDYPPSYSSERMFKRWKAHMEMESADIASGPNILQAVYEVHQVWKASYTEFVDQMKDVKWSKPGSKPEFVTILHDKLLHEVLEHVKSNIKALPDGTAIWGGT